MLVRVVEKFYFNYMKWWILLLNFFIQVLHQTKLFQQEKLLVFRNYIYYLFNSKIIIIKNFSLFLKGMNWNFYLKTKKVYKWLIIKLNFFIRKNWYLKVFFSLIKNNKVNGPLSLLIKEQFSNKSIRSYQWPIKYSVIIKTITTISRNILWSVPNAFKRIIVRSLFTLRVRV